MAMYTTTRDDYVTTKYRRPCAPYPPQTDAVYYGGKHNVRVRRVFGKAKNHVVLPTASPLPLASIPRTSDQEEAAETREYSPRV